LAEVHLSGPFGIGALVLKRGPDGLSLNGAPPSGEVLAQLQQRLGFDLPLDHLRFWLLGTRTRARIRPEAQRSGSRGAADSRRMEHRL